MLRYVAPSLVLLALCAAPVSAEDVLVGMAASQAAEAGVGVCHGVDPQTTQECAQKICMEQSGLGTEDCSVSLWSYPAGWSAQISVLHKEGIGWAEFISDWRTRDRLEAAIKLRCDDPDYAECATIQIWDPFGKPQLQEAE
jgi:hypothetical protein